MRQNAVPLLKFSPSAQQPEVLEHITVQREDIVAGMVEAALDLEGGLRHHLLVGPRGIGKSHVLALVRHRLRAHERAGDVVTAWLEEDPWAVRTYGKFLAAVVAAVGRDLGDEELIAHAADLRARSDAGVEAKAQDALRTAVGDRRLVLLVENLNDIFRRIKADGQSKFRALAEGWGQMLVLASTPQLFPGVSDHALPFYGFFRVTHLDELTLENATGLLKRVTELRGDEELLRFLDSDVAARRLKAVEALAGGHPRIWHLLAGCISVPAIEELVPLFLEALDDLTPYYQDRLRELGDQQQELVVLLSEAGGALTNKALAERSGLPQNQVAAAIGVLEDRGYVRRATVPEHFDRGDRRATYWELREPLMRLCLDVKQARGEPLRIVVEFLRAWYGVRLLDEIRRLPVQARLASLYTVEAVKGLQGPLSIHQLLHGPPSEALERIQRGLDILPDEPSLRVAKAIALGQLGHHAEATEALHELNFPDDGTAALVRIGVRRLSGVPLLRDELAAFAAETQKHRDTEPDDPRAAWLAGLALEMHGDTRGALAAFDSAVGLKPEVSHGHAGRGRVLVALERHEDAAEAFEQACTLDPDDVGVALGLARTLARLGRHREALRAYTRVVELQPSEPRFHFERSGQLSALGEHEESRKARATAASLDPENPLYPKGEALALLQLQRDREALERIEEACALAPDDATVHEIRAYALALAGGPVEAQLDAWTRAIALAPKRALLHYELADVLRRNGQMNAADDHLVRAIELEPDSGIFRFAHAAVAATGVADDAVGSRLRGALRASVDDEEARVDGTVELFTALWHRHTSQGRLPARMLRGIVSTYVVADAGDGVHVGIATTTALFASSDTEPELALQWAASFREASAPWHAAFAPSLDMIEAAAAWKNDRDRAHLLRLPPETRSVLRQILELSERSDGDTRRA